MVAHRVEWLRLYLLGLLHEPPLVASVEELIFTVRQMRGLCTVCEGKLSVEQLATVTRYTRIELSMVIVV